MEKGERTLTDKVKGGSIVKDFVEHFGGKYEVYNDPEALFPVGILIKLPIYED